MNGSSAARVSGKVYREVELLGKKYLLSQPSKIGDVADEQAFILSRRLDPMAFALRAIQCTPPNRHASIWEGCAAAAARGIPTVEEQAAFDASEWNLAFRLWLTLDPKHKYGSEAVATDLLGGVEWAMSVLRSIPGDQLGPLIQAVVSVRQEQEIKNSPGPTETSGPSPSP
jgi:hypothetical protein